MTIVLKYGGNAMGGGDGPDPLLDECAVRVAGGDRLVLVHGGGPQIDAELAERGIAQRRIGGLRVTDADTLAVTERVLCGTVNKALVRALGRRGVRAVGVSGQDGGLLVARPVPAVDGESLGFVGEVVSVDPALLHALLDRGFAPVVAPLATAADGSGALNLNADTAAGAIAGALGADIYVVITNVRRVRRQLNDPASEITSLDVAQARGLLGDGSFDGGMKPKIEGALDALVRGADRVVICGSAAGALTGALQGEGTTIR